MVERVHANNPRSLEQVAERALDPESGAGRPDLPIRSKLLPALSIGKSAGRAIVAFPFGSLERSFVAMAVLARERD